MMYLVGDVGGTKTVLALYQPTRDGLECTKKELYASADYGNFLDLLKVFLAAVESSISAVCIGVAGPIVNGDCVTTNLPWVLKHQEIGLLVNSANVWLLNDLEASAWGLLGLADSDLVELNPNAQPSSGHIAVVAAGTGLGEALMIWDGVEYHAIATEGGHADFAPVDEQQIGLLSYLLKKFGRRISYERVLSGPGLVNIYDYLKHCQFGSIQASTEQLMLQEDPAAVIGESGVAGADPLCVEALNLFCRIYGAEAGNLALKCLPYAGVYLAGGIGRKILPALQNGEFIKSFLNKGRSKSVLANIPVKVCVNPDVAKLGALSYIKQRIVG